MPPRLTRWLPAAGALLALLVSFSSHASAAPCVRPGGPPLRDVHWQHRQDAHPLWGLVLKRDQPIPVADEACTRSPMQQLIVEVWDTIRRGGVVLLGEVHDNPEHHAARADVLWPRLDRIVSTRKLRPAAVFEHIRTSQRTQLEAFYARAARTRRRLGAPDLLRQLAWKDTGWPAQEIFYPLFDAALWAGQPIHPGNDDRARMRALIRGQAEPDQPEGRRLDLARAMPDPLVEALTAELGDSHCGAVPASALGGMSLAQRYTDAQLAEALLEAASDHGGGFLLAGNGHVRTDRGVPWYVRQLAPEKPVVAVMFVETEDGRTDAASYLPRAPDGTAAADYVVFTPRHARADPCETLRKRGR